MRLTRRLAPRFLNLMLHHHGAGLRADPVRFRAQVRELSARARAAGARRLVPGGAAFEGLRFDWAEGLAVDRPVEAAVALLAHALPKPPA